MKFDVEAGRRRAVNRRSRARRWAGRAARSASCSPPNCQSVTSAQWDVTSCARVGTHIPFVTSGSYPVRAGNLVRPLVDGEPAYRRICEAVDAARHSVWVTVTFLTPDVQMPDGRGSFFDVLDRSAARGLDVRVLFWRPNPETSHYAPGVFGDRRPTANCSKRAARGSWPAGTGPTAASASIRNPGSSTPDDPPRRRSWAGSTSGPTRSRRPATPARATTTPTWSSPDRRPRTCTTTSSSAGTKPASAPRWMARGEAAATAT